MDPNTTLASLRGLLAEMDTAIHDDDEEEMARLGTEIRHHVGDLDNCERGRMVGGAHRGAPARPRGTADSPHGGLSAVSRPRRGGLPEHHHPRAHALERVALATHPRGT